MIKGKITMTITIGLACFILVLILFMQFKVVNQTDITSIDTMREEDLRTELTNWKTKYDGSEEKFQEVIETLNKYNEKSNSNSETKKNLEEELEESKLMLGLTDVEGPGLIITLEDPKSKSESEESEESIEKRVSASELGIIINYLKDAGAEAISINNQRIVTNTDIVDIGDENPFIKINGRQRLSSPFEIKVIGDAEYLKSTLIGVGYVNKIKARGQEITFKESKKITINKYDGNLTFKYIEN